MCSFYGHREAKQGQRGTFQALLSYWVKLTMTIKLRFVWPQQPAGQAVSPATVVKAPSHTLEIQVTLISTQ